MPSRSYWNSSGRYQKNYDHFRKLWVPAQGASNHPWGELLRVLSNVYYRVFNDGDSYDDILEWRNVNSVFYHNKRMPEKQRKEVENRLRQSDDLENDLDSIVDYVLQEIMLHHSTPTRIWNPATNRLVLIRTPTGQKALKALDCELSYECHH